MSWFRNQKRKPILEIVKLSGGFQTISGWLKSSFRANFLVNNFWWIFFQKFLFKKLSESKWIKSVSEIVSIRDYHRELFRLFEYGRICGGPFGETSAESRWNLDENRFQCYLTRLNVGFVPEWHIDSMNFIALTSYYEPSTMNSSTINFLSTSSHPLPTMNPLLWTLSPWSPYQLRPLPTMNLIVYLIAWSRCRLISFRPKLSAEPCWANFHRKTIS